MTMVSDTFGHLREKTKSTVSDARLYPSISALRAFEAFARLGGIRSAARELNVDHAVISRHIRLLESCIGAQLTQKEGKGFKLTEQGKSYYRDIGTALEIIARSSGRLRKDSQEYTLRVGCEPDFALLILSSKLPDFIENNSNIELHISFIDSNFEEAEVDCSIQRFCYDDMVVSPLLRRSELIRPDVFPVASPDYLVRSPQIRCAKDLLDHALLHTRNEIGWLRWMASQSIRVPPRLGGLRMGQASVMIEAAKAGYGIALGSQLFMESELKSGRLVRVSPEGAENFSSTNLCSYDLVTRVDRWNAQAVTSFRQWIRGVLN